MESQDKENFDGLERPIEKPCGTFTLDAQEDEQIGKSQKDENQTTKTKTDDDGKTEMTRILNLS